MLYLNKSYADMNQQHESIPNLFLDYSTNKLSLNIEMFIYSIWIGLIFTGVIGNIDWTFKRL